MAVLRVRPLLGDAGRAWAGIALAACAIVVVVTGLLFKGETGPDGFDNAVDSPVITFSRGHAGFLPWSVLPGDLIPAIAVSAAIAAGCLIARRPNGAVLAVTAVPAAAGLDDGLLKHLFHRTYLGVLSFPSGHTTAVTAMTATLAVLLLVPPQQARTRAVRVAVVAAACLITVVVVIGVIGLRFHYFTDTVAGAAAGVGTVLGLALLLDLAADAFARPGTGSPGPAGSSREPGPVSHPSSATSAIEDR
jgi:membrane-associated phospholipid phosphatase